MAGGEVDRVEGMVCFSACSRGHRENWEEPLLTGMREPVGGGGPGRATVEPGATVLEKTSLLVPTQAMGWLLAK